MVKLSKMRIWLIKASGATEMDLYKYYKDYKTIILG